MRRTQERQQLSTSSRSNIIINSFSIILALIPLLISTSMIIQGIITKAQVGIEDEGRSIGWVLVSILFFIVVQIFLRYILTYKSISVDIIDHIIGSFAVTVAFFAIVVIIVISILSLSGETVNNSRIKLLEDNGYHNVMNVQDFQDKFNLEPKSESGPLKLYAQVSGAKNNEWVEIGLNQSNEKLFVSYEIPINLEDISRTAKLIK